MRLVCVSDTHTRHESLDLPPGDVLVHAGDFSHRGELESLRDLARWFDVVPYAHVILVAGNHDFCFEQDPDTARALVGRAIYLQDSGCTIDGVRFWGSPWQPWFYDWAFNLPRGGPELAARWAQIPDDTDVLITHSPPQGIGDTTQAGDAAGCERLTEALARVRPAVHVFGHIHEGRGTSEHDGTLYVNASNLDARYRPAGDPIVIDLDPAASTARVISAA